MLVPRDFRCIEAILSRDESRYLLSFPSGKVLTLLGKLGVDQFYYGKAKCKLSSL